MLDLVCCSGDEVIEGDCGSLALRTEDDGTLSSGGSVVVPGLKG